MSASRTPGAAMRCVSWASFSGLTGNALMEGSVAGGRRKGNAGAEAVGLTAGAGLSPILYIWMGSEFFARISGLVWRQPTVWLSVSPACKPEAIEHLVQQWVRCLVNLVQEKRFLAHTRLALPEME